MSHCEQGCFNRSRVHMHVNMFSLFLCDNRNIAKYALQDLFRNQVGQRNKTKVENKRERSRSRHLGIFPACNPSSFQPRPAAGLNLSGTMSFASHFPEEFA